MESSSKLKYVRQSPYKIRFVADLIRGKNVADAINILSSTNKKASKFLIKLLNSAVANINYVDNDSNFDQSDLYVKTIVYINMLLFYTKKVKRIIQIVYVT